MLHATLEAHLLDDMDILTAQIKRWTPNLGAWDSCLPGPLSLESESWSMAPIQVKSSILGERKLGHSSSKDKKSFVLWTKIKMVCRDQANKLRWLVGML